MANQDLLTRLAILDIQEAGRLLAMLWGAYPPRAWATPLWRLLAETEGANELV